MWGKRECNRCTTCFITGKVQLTIELAGSLVHDANAEMLIPLFEVFNTNTIIADADIYHTFVILSALNHNFTGVGMFYGI